MLDIDKDIVILVKKMLDVLRILRILHDVPDEQYQGYVNIDQQDTSIRSTELNPLKNMRIGDYLQCINLSRIKFDDLKIKRDIDISDAA